MNVAQGIDRPRETQVRGPSTATTPRAAPPGSNARLGELSRLRVLELSDNSIDAVPPGVADLRHLRVLRLDGNRLTAVPPALSRLSPQLRRCSLHGNNIIGTLGTLGALANQEMRIGDDDDGASDDGDSNDDSADSDGDDDDDAKPP